MSAWNREQRDQYHETGMEPCISPPILELWRDADLSGAIRLR
jgi:hypothetical protein